MIFHTKYPKQFCASLRSAQFFLSTPPPLTWNPGSAPVSNFYIGPLYRLYEVNIEKIRQTWRICKNKCLIKIVFDIISALQISFTVCQMLNIWFKPCMNKTKYKYYILLHIILYECYRRWSVSSVSVNCLNTIYALPF